MQRLSQQEEDEKKPIGPRLGSFHPGKVTLGLTMLVNALAFFLLIFVISGATTNEDSLQAFYWSSGRSQEKYNFDIITDNFLRTVRQKIVYRNWYGLNAVYQEEYFQERINEELDDDAPSPYKDINDDAVLNEIEQREDYLDGKTQSDIFLYSDNDCDMSQCSDCEDAGEFCVAAVSLCMVLCICTILFSLVSLFSVEKQLWSQVIALICTLGSITMGFASVGVYVEECYLEADDNDNDQKFGPGLILLIMTSSFLALYFPIQFLDVIYINSVHQ